MTKLANSDIPLEDCCKYMGVTAKTLSIYHRATLGIELRAARLLSAYNPNKQNTSQGSTNEEGDGDDKEDKQGEDKEDGEEEDEEEEDEEEPSR